MFFTRAKASVRLPSLRASLALQARLTLAFASLKKTCRIIACEQIILVICQYTFLCMHVPLDLYITIFFFSFGDVFHHRYGKNFSFNGKGTVYCFVASRLYHNITRVKRALSLVNYPFAIYLRMGEW